MSIMLFMCMFFYGYGNERSGQRGKSTIGISMSSGIVKKQAELSISHAFSQHWSVSGRASIALSIFIDGYEPEEIQHYEEFQNMYEGDEKHRQDIALGCASLKFWPRQCHNGLYLELGCSFGGIDGTDLESSIGYFFPIWRGLCADIAYEISLISSYRNEKMNRNGINIGIHYKF